jgi:transcriptional regulator with XRE-family HTH domain
MKAKRRPPAAMDLNSARALFAKRLREWRKSHGFLLKQVADEFGVAEATWARWEKGSRFPLPEFIPLLAEYIDMPVCHFFYPSRGGCLECPFPRKPGQAK